MNNRFSTSKLRIDDTMSFIEGNSFIVYMLDHQLENLVKFYPLENMKINSIDHFKVILYVKHFENHIDQKYSFYPIFWSTLFERRITGPTGFNKIRSNSLVD